MTTLVLAFAFTALIMAGMAIGVLFGRKPISGSCGGMKALGMDVECEICGGNPRLCDSNKGGNDNRQSKPVVGSFDPKDSG